MSDISFNETIINTDDDIIFIRSDKVNGKLLLGLSNIGQGGKNLMDWENPAIAVELTPIIRQRLVETLNAMSPIAKEECSYCNGEGHNGKDSEIVFPVDKNGKYLNFAKVFCKRCGAEFETYVADTDEECPYMMLQEVMCGHGILATKKCRECEDLKFVNQ